MIFFVFFLFFMFNFTHTNGKSHLRVSDAKDGVGVGVGGLDSLLGLALYNFIQFSFILLTTNTFAMNIADIVYYC